MSSATPSPKWPRSPAGLRRHAPSWPPQPAAAVRTVASSAGRRIGAGQAPAAPAARQAGLVRDFKKAWEDQDIDALIGLLDPGATVIADGGGLAPAALRPIEGAEQIARYVIDLAARTPGNVTFLERTVNGQPGLVAQQDGVTVTVFAFGLAVARTGLFGAVRNPAKLGPWTAGCPASARDRVRW